MIKMTMKMVIKMIKIVKVIKMTVKMIRKEEGGRLDDQKEEKSPIGVTDCKALHHSSNHHLDHDEECDDDHDDHDDNIYDGG